MVRGLHVFVFFVLLLLLPSHGALGCEEKCGLGVHIPRVCGLTTHREAQTQLALCSAKILLSLCKRIQEKLGE
jgi:ABC-type cobalamin transport system permease subunit